MTAEDRDAARHFEELKNNQDLVCAMEAENFDEAIRILDAVLSRNPFNEAALYLLAQCWLAKRDYFSALRCLKICRDMRSSNVYVYRDLGFLYHRLHALDLARSYLKMVLDSGAVSDDDTIARYLMVLQTMGHDDEAVEFIEKRWAAKPDSDSPWVQFAAVWLVIEREWSSGAEKKARALLEKLVSEGSPSLREFVELVKAEKRDGGEKDREKRERENEAQKLLARALEHLKGKDWTAAAEALWAALDHDPRLAVAYTHLGCVYDNLGFLEEGLSMHDYAIRLDAGLALAHSNRAYVLNLMGRMEEAIETYKRALELDPNLVVAMNSLGTLYDNLGHYDKGVAFFRRSLEIEPDKPSTLVDIAYALIALGDHDSARGYLERAIQVAPEWPPPRLLLAQIYIGFDCPDEAEAQALKVLEIDPKAFGAWVCLARCYLSRGDEDRLSEAVGKLSSLLPRGPDDAFYAAELFDRLDTQRSLQWWKFYVATARGPYFEAVRVQHAKKRIEQIEGKTM